MTIYTFTLSLLILGAISSGVNTFQTTQSLPLRIDPIAIGEIRQRLGLKQTDDQPSSPSSSNDKKTLSIGLRADMGYTLMDEHEVLCPLSGTHQGILCTAILPHPIEDDARAESIAENRDLVSQAIMSGSLAASIRNSSSETSLYYLPSVITLVESLMAEDIKHMDLGEKIFNSGGLETNEILMDSDYELGEDVDGVSVMMYACNTSSDYNSATSDVYVLPADKKGTIWRFSVEFKVATINLRSIVTFGGRDSTTPLRPDVWLKDDSY
eukprot:CAMPEP_0201657594 /NCGR_PEP_ID=MMETSP0494-20130426/787_1 /ASSEMBLY_ACC=CAM_ASM_000839 /TAXON_ID=420259 /ORGANISM="Thalassiosira gravida, Strain GMp14c1" /LENGTH=267 /DNA_ID=CAMNT_0048134463 /DNA_START=255 /DNA_END=1058 /DNA_ORIENTATION=-